LKDNLTALMDSSENINFFFSLDDKVVPLSNMKNYQKKLPGVNYFTIDNANGHFFVKTFPSLIKIIKKDLDIK
jgi:alpha/beta superfamily hydrolase